MKVSKVDTIFICILLFLFQPPIEKIFSPFKYYDEIFVLVCFFVYLLKREITKKDLKTLLLFLALVVVGLFGNYFSGSNQLPMAIVQDILSNAKFVLFALAASKFRLNEVQQRKLGDRLSFFIRTLFVVLFILSLISQVIDLGMTDQERYGFKSFQFIFNNPAGLNTYFYLFMVIHSITLVRNGKLRRYSSLFTVIGVLAWISTMRSRAITFAIIYLCLYIYIFFVRKKNYHFRFRWYHTIVAVLGATLVSWDAIEKYFIANDRAARFQLSRTAIAIAKDHFPLGSGFGTFGTEASRAYYSNIYHKYGLSSIWGLNPGHASFITDQYWFAIIGQFGIVGLIIMVMIIYRIYKGIWSFAKVSKPMQLAALTLFFTSIFASITAGTFIQASIIPSLMIFYLFRNEYKTMNGFEDEYDLIPKIGS